MKVRSCAFSSRLVGPYGELIRQLDAERVKQGIDMQSFAEQAGHAYVVWSQICNGHNLNPSMRTIGDFASAVGLKLTLERME